MRVAKVIHLTKLILTCQTFFNLERFVCEGSYMYTTVIKKLEYINNVIASLYYRTQKYGTF